MAIRFLVPLLSLLLPILLQDTPAERPPVPLAYVRRLAFYPVALATPPDTSLPPPPAFLNKKNPTNAEKRAIASWQEQRQRREDFRRLRAETLRSFASSLTEQLRKLSGLTITPLSLSPSLPAAWANTQPAQPELPGTPVAAKSPEGRLELATETLATFARNANVEAILTVAMDRFGTHAGLERVIWLRLIAYVVPADEPPSLRGPFYALGEARASRNLFRRGYRIPDDRLAQIAAASAARHLARLLDTGQEALFARDVRVGIVPASFPQRILKRFERSSSALTVQDHQPVDLTASLRPVLQRHGDVLLQPGFSPVTAVAANDAIAGEMQKLNIQPDRIWEENEPNGDPIRELAARLKLDYVFLSRVTNLLLTESSVLVPDNGQPREGIERYAEAEAEAVMIRVADGRILWRDRQVGSTMSRTEYVRGQPRVRTDEQCLLDATRTVYGYLRSRFGEFLRKRER
jgi:hypothetical protein